MDLIMLGNKIKELRKDKGLSQEQLAGLSGTTGSRISNMEKGKDNVCYNTLKKVATALNCDLDILLKPKP